MRTFTARSVIEDGPRLYRTREVAAFLAISRTAVALLVKAEKIQAKTHGRWMFFAGSEVHRYLRDMPTTGRQNKETP